MFKLLKSRLFLFLLSGVFLVAGAQVFYVAIKNPKPITVSISDYLKNKTDVQWVNLTSVRLDLNKTVYSTTKRLYRIKDIYIPVHSSESNAPKSNIFLKTDNEELKKIMRSGSKISKASQQKIAKNWLNKTSVKGLIQIGLDSDSKIESQIIKLSGMQTVRVLELDASPTPWPAGFIGFALAIGTFVYALKKKSA